MNLEHSKVIENPQLLYGCLHFKYNCKKYLYGLTEELLTCGQQIDLLSKLNGTYEPSEKQKKEKSSLLLKKEKSLMKIDYIILPRKACQHQYLWHFQQVTKKLSCRHFLILPLTKEQRKNTDPGIDFTTRKRIMEVLAEQQQGNSNSLSYSQYGYRFESFKDHQNVIKKAPETINDKKKGSKRLNEEIQDFEKPQEIVPIYEDELNQIVLSLLKKQMTEFSSKSILQYINPKSYLKGIHDLINTIRHNSNLPEDLQLNHEQIQDHKVQLSEQILRISTPDQVFYPTDSQNLKLMFLPQTSMIILLHKHEIMLINPCNLASWKLHYLSFPVSKVKYVLLTRFSIAFVQFIVAWGALGQEQKLHNFLQIATLEHIQDKIKLKLKKVFLWTDEMIRSKIAFRIIPSASGLTKKNLKQQSSSSSKKQQFYPLGFVKVSYNEGQTRQDLWTVKFGNKELCFMNELISFDLKQSQRFEYIIFDKINPEKKQQLYSMSVHDSVIRKKFIYNRSSSSKFKNKYFFPLEQSCPIVTLHSSVRIQQTFLPFCSSKLDEDRYEKVKLQPGESINCLDRNIIVVEGLVLAVYPKTGVVFLDGMDKEVVQTQVELCYPADLVKNGMIFDLNLVKIRNIYEMVCLKQALVLVEEVQNQTFYSNILGKKTTQQIVESKHMGMKKIPFNQLLLIGGSELEIQAVSQNTLVKFLSAFSSNFAYSHTTFSQQTQPNEHKDRQFAQSLSPYHHFDTLLKKISFQSGQIINPDNSKAYFILKGLLKWDDRNDQGPKAKSNAFIGNLAKYFEQQIKKSNPQINFQYSQDIQVQPIKVVKDTYVLQADLLELYERYFVHYPEVAYWILQKGSLFY